MDIHEALAQVSEIRLQIARTETFRGYRSLPAAFSSLVAVCAAAIQPLAVPEPTAEPLRYVTLWVGAALVCLIATAMEMTLRCRRSGSSMASRRTLQAVEQFLPSLIAGGLVTLVIAQRAVESLWMLPGLWSILFSLGVFASCRLLPRPVFCIALYYLACGIMCLALAQGELAFTPWSMALTFGGGQLLTAVILYLTLERNHADI